MPHIHDLYDFTVGFFVVHKDRVLLVEHPRYGKWLAPGGHIELDEDPEEALLREIAEETGLSVEILSDKPNLGVSKNKPLFTPNYMDVHDANAPHKHIGLVYFARSATDKARLSAEHTSLKWFTEAELHDQEYNIDPAVIFYAQQALAKAH
jgi:8-oxo-dGTP diphosphatase